LHLDPTQTRKRTNEELPHSNSKLLTYRHPFVRFLQKTRAWSRPKSFYPVTTLVQIIHYASPNYTYHPQVNIHWIIVLKIFSPFRIFEQIAPALKNSVFPEIFHCIECAFYIQDFWATCSCPEKQSVPWIHCIEYIFFIIQDFWATCACLEKQSLPWIHCSEYIFFIIQDFCANCTCPEKLSCHDIFHCIAVFLIIQDFWATCACPENGFSPRIFQAKGTATAPSLRTPMGMTVVPLAPVPGNRQRNTPAYWPVWRFDLISVVPSVLTKITAPRLPSTHSYCFPNVCASVSFVVLMYSHCFPNPCSFCKFHCPLWCAVLFCATLCIG